MVETVESNQKLSDRIHGIFNRAVSLKLLVAVVVMVALPLIAPYFWSKRQQQLPPPNADDQGIKNLIEEVKKELTQVSDDTEKRHEAALFQLKSFDLEITFVAQSSTKNSAGAKYELITTDNQLEISSGRTQKLMLHMDVVPPEKKTQELTSGSMKDGTAKITEIGPTPPEDRRTRKGNHQ